jgi:hypothetical protein
VFSERLMETSAIVDELTDEVVSGTHDNPCSFRPFIGALVSDNPSRHPNVWPHVQSQNRHKASVLHRHE